MFTVTGTPSASGLYDDMFGSSVAIVGDVTGDGVPDFAVGAPQSSPPGQYVRVFSGATATTLITISAPDVGWSLAGVGDVSGDGIPDFGSGLHGTTPARIFSGASGATLYAFAEPSSGFGRTLAGAGDLNGDGIPEIAVGSPFFAVSGNSDVGRVRVFSVAGIPPGSGTLGSGCPGSSGAVPIIQAAGGNPSPGNAAFSLVLAKALGGTSALLVAGTSPLLLNLGPLGLPACTLLVLPDIVVPATTSPAGVAFVPVPVPPVPSLAGQGVLFQWYVVDPGPSPLPGSMTQGLQVLIVP
jgi:hypothetical protein